MKTPQIPDLVSCPWCAGSGKIKPQVYTMLEPGKPARKGKSFTLTCVLCDGSGKITQAKSDALKSYWCECLESTFGSFHEDGQCQDERKHHYHCGKCGQINQVG